MHFEIRTRSNLPTVFEVHTIRGVEYERFHHQFADIEDAILYIAKEKVRRNFEQGRAKYYGMIADEQIAYEAWTIRGGDERAIL